MEIPAQSAGRVTADERDGWLTEVNGDRHASRRVMDHPASRPNRVQEAHWGLLFFGLIASAITSAVDDQGLAMVHQTIDDRGGQRIVDVEDLAPLPEDAIGGDHDRTTLIAGGHHLEHQVGTPLVDREVPQFVQQQELGTRVFSESLLQRAVDLRGGEHVDHVDRARPPDGDFLFTSGVPQRIEQMAFSRSGSANQHGALMLRDELAVKQAEDPLFGNAFGEGEVVVFQRLPRRQLGLPYAPLQRPLVADA